MLNKNENYLGKELSCDITGYKGIAIARVEYLNGCLQYCLKSKINEDGKIDVGEYIDYNQLSLTGDGISVNRSDSGGPSKDTPKG